MSLICIIHHKHLNTKHLAKFIIMIRKMSHHNLHSPNIYNGLYCLDVKTLNESLQINIVDNSSYICKDMTLKLGHLNYIGLKFMFENEIAKGILTNLCVIEEVCRGYQLRNLMKEHFPKNQTQTLELIE
jgi:hypothetical protein